MKDRMAFVHFVKSRKKIKNNGIFPKWKPTTSCLGTRAEKRLQRTAKCYVRNIIELNLEYNMKKLFNWIINLFKSKKVSDIDEDFFRPILFMFPNILKNSVSTANDVVDWRKDYLVKNKNFTLNEKEYTISDMLDDDYLIEQPEIKEICKQAMIKKYGSIRAMNRKIKLDRKAFLNNSSYAISIKHLKLSGVYEDVKSKLKIFKTPKGKIIKIKRLTENHFYLMGLIASDGNNTKEKGTKRYTRIKFHNKEKKLIDKFIEIYTELFPTIKISKKKVRENLFELDSSNSLFA